MPRWKSLASVVCGSTQRQHLSILAAVVWLFVWSFVKLAPDSSADEEAVDDGTLAGRTVGVCGFVAILWMTEAIPMPASALMPVVLFPLLGVLSADEAAETYVSDTIMLFIGSFVLSVAMERVRLHARIALRLLLLVGARPRLLLGGFMLATALLSMWMSNTATASMMVPLAMTTLLKLGSASRRTRRKVSDERNLIATDVGDSDDLRETAVELESDSSDRSSIDESLDDKIHVSRISSDAAAHGTDDSIFVSSAVRRNDGSSDEEASSGGRSADDSETNRDVFAHFSPDILRFCKGVLLGIAYSASVGGTSTLVGTGPNLILQQQLRTNFAGFELSFGQWFAFAFPFAFLFLAIVWVGFCVVYVPKPAMVHVDIAAFREQYVSLGPMSFSEKVVLADMLVMAILWFSRTGLSEDAPGWGALFGGPGANVPRDGTVSILCAVILFIVPVRPSLVESKRVMEWSYTRDLPWGIILVLGGGFCLARATLDSGLALWIGNQLRFFDDMSRYAFVSLLCALIIFTTEMTSNVATANMILPILAAIARSLGENPLLFMVPATISCSFAFALPAATPPNALAFSPGILRVLDMAKPGMCLNLLGIVILPLWMFSVGVSVFDIEIGEAPEWSVQTP